MINSDKTLIAALLDRSGSMARSKRATEDGWREFIDGQRGQTGQCQVTLMQFDTEYEIVYPVTDIAEVPEFVVQPRGATALLDATAAFVTDIGRQLAALPEDDRPGHVICFIMTDGMENSSHIVSWDEVKAMVEQQRTEWNWEFIFLGANIDAVEVGGRMGFDENTSLTFDDSDYQATTVGYLRAREMVRRRRNDEDAAFSDDDRKAAMGTSTM